MASFRNRILRVNLSNSSFSEDSFNDRMIHDYIGGRGFGVKMLYDDLKPGTDPLGEDSELIFLTGPLCGTHAQSFSRTKVFFKSPLTGGYFKSAAGGFWGPELKYSGFDAVVVSGIAEKPVYLWIHDGKYELRDAGYLWGLDCDDTHTLIREELHDPQVRLACIGPAGENGVRYAGIFTDRRAAGRGGGGMVMGAKKLKAIACRGKEPVEPVDKEAFNAAVKEQLTGYRANQACVNFSKTGTQIAEFTNLLGMFPVRNFREGILPGWQAIEGDAYAKLRARKEGCHACSVHCGNLTRVYTGKYAGAWTEGPEYETTWAFTGPMGKADIALTIAADKLCDDLGLDTITTGSTIGFAYELFEKGLITKKDTGGIALKYGDNRHVMDLIRKIAYRKGFGDLLAEGSIRAARRIGQGAEKYAIQVKGLELPAYDPRGAKAHGLNLMTSNIGADHNSGYGGQEVFGSPVPFPVDRFEVKRKGELTKWNQDQTAMLETGIICSFVPSWGGLTEEVFGKLMAAGTGIPEFADVGYLWIVGERIYNLERMFNVREGFSSADDAMPERFSTETLPDGPSKGQVFEAKELLRDYYIARGWDTDTGVPTNAKLEELGLAYTVGK
jgi:aldehyde:ferredoxin oxidoreductase